MLPLTLLIGIFAWNSGIDAYRIGPFNKTAVENRSGGFPKFPQSFLVNSGDNHFIHGFYLSHKNPEHLPVNHRNTCGTRSVPFNPKRSGKIIGGKSRSGFELNTYAIATTIRRINVYNIVIFLFRSCGTIRRFSVAS